MPSVKQNIELEHLCEPIFNWFLNLNSDKGSNP